MHILRARKSSRASPGSQGFCVIAMGGHRPTLAINAKVLGAEVHTRLDGCPSSSWHLQVHS